MQEARRRAVRSRLQRCASAWMLDPPSFGPWARAHTPIGMGVGSLLALCVAVTGCKSSTVTEVRGKTAFGPEFRNLGNNTSEVRYDARQNIELKWDNGWTNGLTYRRRDVDEGSGNNENLFLFDVGYPIWKAPKKPDKTAQQIQNLEEQIQEMRARLAALGTPTNSAGEPRLAGANDVSSSEE